MTALTNQAPGCLCLIASAPGGYRPKAAMNPSPEADSHFASEISPGAGRRGALADAGPGALADAGPGALAHAGPGARTGAAPAGGLAAGPVDRTGELDLADRHALRRVAG